MAQILNIVLDNNEAPSNNKKIELSGSTNSNHLIYLELNLWTACLTNHPNLYTGDTSYPCLLSASTLEVTTGVIGDYLIWWRWNSTDGDIILTSSNQGNSDGNVSHPFENIPVPGGLLYPVIQYIYIDDYKYTIDGDGRYSPDLVNCLPPVKINDMECNNGTNPIEQPNYSHGINYNYISSLPDNSSRTITFLLNSGGTTKYFAWNFRGYTIPDTLKISYSGSSNDVLSYWKVGTQSNTTNYTLSPKQYNTSNNFKSISNLSANTYVNGDYLKIELTPNPDNINTNWDLYMKCITGNTFDFNCTTFPYGWNIIDSSITPTMILVTGSTQCSYEVTFNNKSGSTFLDSDFHKYFTYSPFSLENNYNINLENNINKIRLYNYTNYELSYIQFNSITNYCSGATGSISIIYTGNTIELSFSHETDYLKHKNSYNSLISNANMTNYTTDNTDINHYKRITLNAVSGTSCGDTNWRRDVKFHINSPILFEDSIKKITIELSGTTNGVIQENCNNLYSKADDLSRTGFTTYTTTPDFPWLTNVMAINPFSGTYIPSPTITIQTGITTYHGLYIHPTIVNNVCTLSDWWYYTGNTGSDAFNPPVSSQYHMIYKFRVKAEITDMEDPLNNWKLYSGLETSTNNTNNNGPGPWVQIYP